MNIQHDTFYSQHNYVLGICIWILVVSEEAPKQ